MSKKLGKKEFKDSSSTEYPTEWSSWQWSSEHQRFARYCLVGPDDYRWDYREASAGADPITPRFSQTLESVPESTPYSISNNYTANPISTVSQALERTTLSDTEPAFNDPATHITPRDPSTQQEKFYPHYKVHAKKEFQWGKIFKVLWTEPKGHGGNQVGADSEYSVKKGKYGETHHEKIRRFLIVDLREGHCLCLPINTYRGQGVMKKGVHANEHAIIWTDKAPVMFKGEDKKGMTKAPIRVAPFSSRHKLDEASRLNYAKLYTVEYNVKVWFVGRIHQDSEYQLTADYNVEHPPMPVRGYPMGATAAYTSIAYTSTYATAYATGSMGPPSSADAYQAQPNFSSYQTATTQGYAGAASYNPMPASTPNEEEDSGATQGAGDEAAQPEYERHDDLYDAEEDDVVPRRRDDPEITRKRHDDDDKKGKRRPGSGGGRSGHRR